MKIQLASKSEKELIRVLHNSIKGISEDTVRMQFNTPISRMMEAVNELYRYIANDEKNNDNLIAYTIKTLIKCIAPFAPHLAEELWGNGRAELFSA